jgi:O-antigen/teichoic acid export membrane protein
LSLELQAIAGVKWGVVAKVVTQVVAWMVTLIVIRVLTPGDYGLMALCTAVTSVIAGLAELGLGASLVHARVLTKSDLARVAGALLLLNTTCAILAICGAGLFAALFGDPRLALIIQVSSLQFVLAAVVAVPESLAYRAMNFKWLAMADIATGLTISVTTLAFALLGFGVWALVVGNLAGAVVRSTILLMAGTAVWPTLNLSGIGQFLRYGGAWAGARFAWQLTYISDILIAGRFLTEPVVGTYSVAQQLSNMPLGKVMGIVNQVAFPAIARLQDDLPRMRKRVLEAIRLMAGFAIPSLWGLALVADELISVVLGERWQSAVLPLQLISVVGPLRMVSALLATAVSAMGRADIELGNTIRSLVIFVVTILIAVRWGLFGLSVGYGVAVALSFTVTLSRTARTLNVSTVALFRACSSAVASSVAMCLVVMALRPALLGIDTWLRLTMLIVVGAAVYAFTLALIDRPIWSDARKVVTALRSGA